MKKLIIGFVLFSLISSSIYACPPSLRIRRARLSSDEVSVIRERSRRVERIRQPRERIIIEERISPSSERTIEKFEKRESIRERSSSSDCPNCRK